MKKLMIALTVMLLTAAKTVAMSYEQARNEALFLTDKMAYELNLTDAQYEAAYEINLDYLMGVANYDDVFGPYWERRNLDLSYVLFDWQWDAFRAATYFYRPLFWDNGFWHFAIYNRYPHRDYFYFGRPVFYASYRGGHAWHVVGGQGYYYARRDHYRPAPIAGHTHFGMLDRWNRGDFGSGRSIGHRPVGHQPGPSRPIGTRPTSPQPRVSHPQGSHSGVSHTDTHRSNSSFGGYRSSSTRTTATQPSGHNRSFSSGSGSSHSSNYPSSGSGRSFGGSRSHTSSHSSGSFSGGSSHSSSGSGRSFGGRR